MRVRMPASRTEHQSQSTRRSQSDCARGRRRPSLPLWLLRRDRVPVKLCGFDGAERSGLEDRGPPEGLHCLSDIRGLTEGLGESVATATRVRGREAISLRADRREPVSGNALRYREIFCVFRRPLQRVPTCAGEEASKHKGRAFCARDPGDSKHSRRRASLDQSSGSTGFQKAATRLTVQG